MVNFYLFPTKYKLILLIPGAAIRILDSTTKEIASLAAFFEFPIRFPFSSSIAIPLVNSLLFCYLKLTNFNLNGLIYEKIYLERIIGILTQLAAATKKN